MRLSNILKVGGRIVAVCAAVVVMAQPVLAQAGTNCPPLYVTPKGTENPSRDQLLTSRDK